MPAGHIRQVAFTDEDGRCDFGPLPTGEYRVTAEAADMASTERFAAVTSAFAAVAITLDPGREVSGHVRLEGVPLPGARVTAVPVEGVPAIAATALTDSNGWYRIATLDRALYTVTVVVDWQEAGARRAPADAVTHAQQTLDFELVPTARSVSGTVTDTLGRLVAGYRVVLRAPDGVPVAETLTDVSGRYHLSGGDITGTCAVAAADGRYGPATVPVDIANDDPADVDLVLAGPFFAGDLQPAGVQPDSFAARDLFTGHDYAQHTPAEADTLPSYLDPDFWTGLQHPIDLIAQMNVPGYGFSKAFQNASPSRRSCAGVMDAWNRGWRYLDLSKQIQEDWTKAYDAASML